MHLRYHSEKAQRKKSIKIRAVAIVREVNPNSMEELVDKLTAEFQASREEIVTIVLEMMDEEKLSIVQPTQKNVEATEKAVEFNIVFMHRFLLAFTFITFCVALFAPNTYPFYYMRYFFGIILTTFLPGFSFLLFLFPKDGLSYIERFAISIVTSFGLVAVFGYVLSNTVFGLSLETITVALTIWILVLGVAAYWRYEKKLKLVQKK